MKETKFKAWGKKYKRMEYNIQKNRWIKGCGMSPGMELTFEYYIENDNYNIMQFIGLYDKNDTEIYEGDLIVFREYPDEKFTVYWREECAQFCFKTKGGHIELPKFSNISINNSEIIGNIHEHKELL